MKFNFISMSIVLFFVGCSDQIKNPEVTLNEYIKAANEHNIEKVRAMYSDSIVWYFGPFTFSGKEEATQPLYFDKGANTVLTISNISVSSDTVDFNMVETNDVIIALGIPELHHYPRFIIKDGLINSISEIKPPLEIRSYIDSVSAFAMWLSENKPDKFEQFWPGGKFNFSEETGKEMPLEVAKWRNRFDDNSEEKK